MFLEGRLSWVPVLGPESEPGPRYLQIHYGGSRENQQEDYSEEL